MVDKTVVKTADQEALISEEDAERGMSEEAKAEFAKRVMASRVLAKRTKGADNFKGKVISILAMGPTRGQCPFDSETWGVNTGWKQAMRVGEMVDKLFLAHTQVISEEGNPYFIWSQLNKLPFEVINIHRVKGLNAKIFPLKRIMKKFDTEFFSDTICYMLAYALDQYTFIDKKDNNKLKLKEPLMLKLYGCDIQSHSEYQTEKGGIEYWLGYAQGLGVEYYIAFGGTLLITETGKPYGVKQYHKKDVIPDEWRGKKLYKGGRVQGYDFLQGQIRHALSRGERELNQSPG